MMLFIVSTSFWLKRRHGLRRTELVPQPAKRIPRSNIWFMKVSLSVWVGRENARNVPLPRTCEIAPLASRNLSYLLTSLPMVRALSTSCSSSTTLSTVSRMAALKESPGHVDPSSTASLGRYSGRAWNPPVWNFLPHVTMSGCTSSPQCS